MNATHLIQNVKNGKALLACGSRIKASGSRRRGLATLLAGATTCHDCLAHISANAYPSHHALLLAAGVE